MVSKGYDKIERRGKVQRRTARTHAVRASYNPIVPSKQANEGPQPRMERGRRPEESGQERGLVKGNAEQSPTPGTQGPGQKVSRGLIGVRQAAERDRQLQFTALLHHITEQRLAESFRGLRRDAAAGVDEVRWEQYEQGLEGRLADLHSRIHRGSYRAQPSRRTHIGKEDGQLRPLGISALEDKIVQAALSEVLNQIYEVDFMGFSYGFRPGRSQHQALDALAVGICNTPVNWILDTDIRSFFDSVSQRASMISRALFISVAESIVILRPIVQVGCTRASSTVTPARSSRWRKGPPLQHNSRRLTSSRRQPATH